MKLCSTTNLYLSNVGKVHPDPICISSQREPSHLVHSSCSSVDALVLDCRPPILHLVADLGECPKSIKLSLDHLAIAPGSETPDPDLGCSICLAVANLALELSNVLPTQLFLGNSSHVEVLEPHEGESIAGARRGAFDIDVHQLSVAPKDPSHLFVRDVQLQVASEKGPEGRQGQMYNDAQQRDTNLVARGSFSGSM